MSSGTSSVCASAGIVEVRRATERRDRTLERPTRRAHQAELDAADDDAGLPYVLASEIQPERVNWLWKGRIASGMLNLLVGAGGVGKSTILYNQAARLSRQGKKVLVVTAEDHHAAVVAPRLHAADAELKNIGVWTNPLVLPRDHEQIEAAILSLDAALVTVDPLVAFLSGAIDTHRDGSVRQALKPLADIAERTGAAVVVVVHLNKSPSDEPHLRIGGSGAFLNAARHVLLAAPDPSDPSDVRRVLAVVKSNLAQFPPALVYRIEEAAILAEDGGSITTSRVCWLKRQIKDLDPRSLLRASMPEEVRTVIQEAIDFLKTELADGGKLSSDLLRQAGEHNISERTLKRAKSRLHVISKPLKNSRGEFQGWSWRLPR